MPSARANFAADVTAETPRLRAAARRLAGEQEADDAVQATVLRALENAHRFDGDRLGAWLGRILENVAHDARRRGARLHYDGGAAADELRVEPAQEWRARLADAKAALDRLPPRTAEALLLKAAMGFNDEELAAHLGCAVGTAKSRVQRAKLLLAHPT